MKVLVTGAAGFIGFHVAQRLLQRGDTVVGLDNLNDYYDPALKESRLAVIQDEPEFSFVRMDLEDDKGVKYKQLIDEVEPKKEVKLNRSQRRKQ